MDFFERGFSKGRESEFFVFEFFSLFQKSKKNSPTADEAAAASAIFSCEYQTIPANAKEIPERVIY